MPNRLSMLMCNIRYCRNSIIVLIFIPNLSHVVLVGSLLNDFQLPRLRRDQEAMHQHVLRQQRMRADRLHALSYTFGGGGEALEPPMQVDAGVLKGLDHGIFDAALARGIEDCAAVHSRHPTAVVAD